MPQIHHPINLQLLLPALSQLLHLGYTNESQIMQLSQAMCSPQALPPELCDLVSKAGLLCLQSPSRLLH